VACCEGECVNVGDPVRQRGCGLENPESRVTSETHDGAQGVRRVVVLRVWESHAHGEGLAAIVSKKGKCDGHYEGL
jgi:hypothetical protein